MCKFTDMKHLKNILILFIVVFGACNNELSQKASLLRKYYQQLDQECLLDELKKTPSHINCNPLLKQNQESIRSLYQRTHTFVEKHPDYAMSLDHELTQLKLAIECLEKANKKVDSRNQMQKELEDSIKNIAGELRKEQRGILAEKKNLQVLELKNKLQKQLIKLLNYDIKLIKQDQPANYEDYIHLITSIRKKHQNYLNVYDYGPNSDEAFNKVSELLNMEMDVRQQYEEYQNLPENPGKSVDINQIELKIDKINDFLERYPQTIVKNELENRLEKMQFARIEIVTSRTPDNIFDLNLRLNEMNRYMQKFEDYQYRQALRRKLIQLINMRQTIFVNEYNRKRQEMFKYMEATARKHNNSEVHELCRNIISSKEINASYINKKPLSYKEIGIEKHEKHEIQYELLVKGGFACLSDYKVVIQVKGVISGSAQDGVIFTTSATTLSDKKVD